jgi:hypothetical protein
MVPNGDRITELEATFPEGELEAFYHRVDAFVDRAADISEEEIHSFISTLSETKQELFDAIIDRGEQESYENFGGTTFAEMDSLSREMDEAVQYFEGVTEEIMSEIPLQARDNFQDCDNFAVFDEEPPEDVPQDQWLTYWEDRVDEEVNNWISRLKIDDIDQNNARIRKEIHDLSAARMVSPINIVRRRTHPDTTELGQLLNEKKLFEQKNPQGDPEWLDDWIKRLDHVMDKIIAEAERTQS